MSYDSVNALNTAIRTLSGLSSSGATRRRRTMSAAARARISASQKARWAQTRGQKVVSIAPKRHISAAGLANIRKATRAEMGEVESRTEIAITAAFAKSSAQRVCNGTYRECDPILHSNPAHQLGYVRLDRAITDAQGVPISLLDRPSTSIFKTCVSRSVKATWSVGKICRGELLMRSMNVESTRRGTQTEPRLTIRIACTKSAGDAAAST